MSGGLARRDAALRELMDDADCDPVRLRRTLQRFEVVNSLVAGWDRVYRTRIRPHAHAHGDRLSVLDIGCGAGDVLRRLCARARADGIRIDATGIDPDQRALTVARARPAPGVAFRHAYSADLVAEGQRFDLVISNHVLHHLDDPQLTAFLTDSVGLSTGLVLHSDIARSRAAYAAYAVAITPLAPGSFLRTDGLRSIRRSWTPDELAARLPAPWRVERPASFRLLAVRELTDADGPRPAGANRPGDDGTPGTPTT